MSNNETTPKATSSQLVQAAFVRTLALLESGELPADAKSMGALSELNRIAGALKGIEEAQEALSQGRSIPQQLELFEADGTSEQPRAVLPESRL